MQMYSSPTSPFARKARVTAHELGLDARITLINISLSPVNPHRELRAHNPLGKLPALITDAGETLYDSPVICEYLDTLAGGGRIFPASGPARWTALRRQALADGLTDATVLVRYETAARPTTLQWQEWIEGQFLKVRTALDALETEDLGGAFDIGAISVACALGYLDFRFPEERWRETRPRLAAWHAALSERPSLASTRPS